MNQKTAFRTAAVLFADDSNLISTRTIHKKLIQSIFLDLNNAELGINQLLQVLKERLDLVFDENEIVEIINKDRKNDFVVRNDKKTEEIFLRLTEDSFNRLVNKNKKLNIESFISEYCENIYKGQLSKENVKDAFFRYFYELLNKNINAFKKIISAIPQGDEIGIDPSKFSIEERTVINDFLTWEKPEKNKAIFSLASCSIEYACISNDINIADSGLDAISKKYFYLDNNLIYRAIGLNGDFRQNRTLTFLRKSKENGQKFFISKFTIQEFRQTINYHIGLLQRIPFGKINPTLFTKYALRPTIYEFYHKWRLGKSAYGFDLFLAHIRTLYQRFIREFEIAEDYRIGFDETDDLIVKSIEKYTAEIGAFKGNDLSNDSLNRFDALNTYFIEKKRGENNKTISDTKYYFLSADVKLRNWDFARGNMQPIALLPSQWMSIILKYFARTDDDYKSFIQFLQLSKDMPIINEDKLQVILAGISEMTEDFQRQEDILKRMLEVKFEKTVDIKKIEESRDRAVEFTKSILEEELSQIQGNHGKEIERLEKRAIEKQKAAAYHQHQLLSEYKESYRQMNAQKISIDIEIESRFKKFCVFLIGVAVVWYLIIGFLIVKFGWDFIEPIIYLLGVGGALFGYIYIAVKGKDLNPVEFFRMEKEKIADETYLKYGFTVDRFEYLKEKIDVKS